MRLNVLIFLCWVSVTHAQQLHPACQVGATWNYIYTKSPSLPVTSYLQTLRCIKDTTIGIHRVSVIQADTELHLFRPFTYLAKDDSGGLYFFQIMNGRLEESPSLTFRFRDSMVMFEEVFYQEGSQMGILFLERNIKRKFYSNQDSVEFYAAFISKYYNSNFIHPKYLNMDYGALSRNSYFGVLDFSRHHDLYSLALNCYTDSSCTIKFIKAYKDKGCDYTGLKSVPQTNQTYTVFPNPCMERIFLSESLSTSINEIEIHTTLGSCVYTSNDISKVKLMGISVESWASGIYFYTIKGNEFIANGKLVKE